MTAVEPGEYLQQLDALNQPKALGQEKEEVPFPPAPPFPEGVLPPVVEAYAHTAARSIGVPVEMIAVPLLVSAGATIGNQLRLCLKRGFEQYPTLFAAVISAPGTAKSPSMQAALAPVHRLQQDFYAEYVRERETYQRDLESWNASEKPRGPKPLEPRLEHVYSTDLTIEALGRMLEGVPGVAILRDEILSWVTTLNQYRAGKGDDRQQYLSLWSGTPIKKDRSAAATILVNRPVIGVYGGIQPDLLKGLHNSSGDRDGFIERLLLFFPDVPPMRWTDNEVPSDLLDSLIDTFRMLRVIGRGQEADCIDIHLSSGARALWVEWFNETLTQAHALSGLRAGFTAKLPNQVARFALILHALWNPDDPREAVLDECMRDAIELGEFFQSHLDRVLPLLGDSNSAGETGLRRRVLRLLGKQRLTTEDGWMRRSNLLNGLGNVTSDELSQVLDDLEAEGKVERRTISTATKTAEEWRLR